MNPSAIRIFLKPYQRLSPQDDAFLAFEQPHLHMHIGAVTVFEDGAFRLPDGRLDVALLRSYIASRLPKVPRCRQRLARTTLLRRPIWVDDQRFRIEDRVRVAETPAPLDEAGLHALAGEIFSTPLDRARPLWEMHVVERLAEPGRFAVICKIHHAMIDGLAGIDFIGAMLGAAPTTEFAPAPFSPRPLPGRLRLLWDDVTMLAWMPIAGIFTLRRLVLSQRARRLAWWRTIGLVRLLATGIRGTPESPLSERALPQRTFATLVSDRAEERAIRAGIGGSHDDVTLAAAAGAARNVLLRHGANPARLRVRTMAPMSLRSRKERGALGNRVSMLIVDLPVGEADPRRRLERTTECVAYAKSYKQGLGVDILAGIDRLTGTLAQNAAMWLATTRRAYSVMVTNIAGPTAPLYLLDGKMLALYPMAPVFGGQHISVAVLHYMGRLHWGVQYAGTTPGEANRIAEDLRAAFADMLAAAGEAEPRLRVIEPRTPADEAARAAGAQI